MLGRLVLEHQCEAALEIGLANGFSSLFILDALDQIGRGSLTSLDPFQHSDWQGRGLERIARAGFPVAHQFLEAASWQALPRAVQEGNRFDFALIDGSHSFDNAFVDFYFVDKLVVPGGIVVFDDVGWAGVERVVHYVIANRDYEIIASLPRSRTSREVVLAPLKRAAARLARTHRTPTPAVYQREESVNRAGFIALRKTGDRPGEGKFEQF